MKNYTLEQIPHWCRMPHADHFDGLGGCWGISQGEVEKKGEQHCSTCEFYDKQDAEVKNE